MDTVASTSPAHLASPPQPPPPSFSASTSTAADHQAPLQKNHHRNRINKTGAHILNEWVKEHGLNPNSKERNELVYHVQAAGNDFWAFDNCGRWFAYKRRSIQQKQRREAQAVNADKPNESALAPVHQDSPPPTPIPKESTPQPMYPASQKFAWPIQEQMPTTYTPRSRDRNGPLRTTLTAGECQALRALAAAADEISDGFIATCAWLFHLERNVVVSFLRDTCSKAQEQSTQAPEAANGTTESGSCPPGSSFPQHPSEPLRIQTPAYRLPTPAETVTGSPRLSPTSHRVANDMSSNSASQPRPSTTTISPVIPLANPQTQLQTPISPHFPGSTWTQQKPLANTQLPPTPTPEVEVKQESGWPRMPEPEVDPIAAAIMQGIRDAVATVPQKYSSAQTPRSLAEFDALWDTFQPKLANLAAVLKQ